MLLNNKQIAIVGGGPGGLTLARLLQLKGADVKVYERDFNAAARVQGTTLDLHEESGLEALRKAGLLDEFKKNYRPGADKMIIVNEKGAVFFSDHDKPEEDFGSEHFRPEIDRGPLRKILLESLQPDTVIWDSQFVSMEKQNGGWLLHFKNKTTAYADIVIGADGANSRIRPYLTDIKPFYSGITGVLASETPNSETTLPNIHTLLQDGKIMGFGGGKSFTVASKGDGSLAFYLAYKVAEEQLKNIDFTNKQEVLSWFKRDFPEWNNHIWRELFENAATTYMPIPIYCMPLDQTWPATPNLTLLGDAAHLMPPFAGEGVNMAMLDALELSYCLYDERFSDLQTAIAYYENEMRERASAAAKESLENGEKMHSADSLQTMLAFFNGVPGR